MQVPSNHPLSPEIQFLTELDGLKDEEAEQFISTHNEMYQKCLSLIIKEENTADSHPKALNQIFTKIDSSNSAIVDSKELLILKICSDKGIVTKHLLHAAVESDDIKLVRALLESGVDPNSLDDDNTTPLCYLYDKDFSEEDRKEIAHLFLKNPNFNLKLNLINAYSSKNYEMMKLLVEQGASIDYVDEGFKFIQSYGNFYTGNPNELTNQALFEIFKLFPGSDKIEEKILTALFRVWTSPINTSSQTNETLKLFANFLIEQPSFGISFPNFTTHLIKLIMTNPSSLKLIGPCLDSSPWLIKGQQGKELMREAVEKNNPLVVRELVKRGFDLTEFYGSPLTVKNQMEQEIYKTRTPWQHAVLKNHSEIVEIMLNAGISIDLKNKQGKSAIGVLLETQEIINIPRCWNSHKETLNLLISRGADIECTNDSGRTLLACIVNEPKVENRPWPLTIQLLKRNALITQEEQWILFEQAINDKQLSAASMISNHFVNILKTGGDNAFNLLKNVNLLAKIINLQSQSWSQTILTDWVNAGVNLNDFVAIEQTASIAKGTSLLSFVIAKKKNYSLAALLISLGADINLADDNGLTPKNILESQNIEPADLMIYAETLKQGSIAKQELRRELFIRNLGHLLADDFLKKMTNTIGDKLEGNMSSYSLAFMQKILTYILERHGRKFLGDEQNTIKALIHQMQLAQDLAIQIEDIPSLGAQS
ncbi:MAG TPA: ankyrin repeat domain-containing protein, partial [Parachlamydiaceae bacterium]|nr:ankyrin repeat domain-containing protein [Parachlamydiaceae bacterium]